MEPRQIAQRHKQRASAALEIGRFPLAEREARAALALDPRDPDARLYLARALLGQGRHAEAEVAAEDGVAASPRDGYAHYILGFVRQVAGRHGAAIEPLQEAARLDPRAARYHSRLAIALGETRDRVGAAAAMERALAHETEDALLYCEGARVYVLVGDLARAEALARRGVSLAPDSAHAHGLLAWVLSRAKNYDGACVAARAALAIDPNNVGAWADLGCAAFSLGRLDDAEWALREALRLSPGLTSATCNLANALIRRGALAEAESVCDAALALDATNAAVHAVRDQVRATLRERASARWRSRVALAVMLFNVVRLAWWVRTLAGGVVVAALVAVVVYALWRTRTPPGERRARAPKTPR